MADLYADSALVEEVFVDTLINHGIDRDLALRLADGDADHPWSDIVRALRYVSVGRGHSLAGEVQGLRGIVVDLVDSLRGQCDLDWLASTERPSALPVLFTDKPSSATRLSARFMRECGWLATGERVLCPDHVAAAEKQAEAELCGLPFEL